MSIPRVIAVAALLCAALAAAPAGASSPSPWSPYRSSDFTLPAGARCPFALAGHVVFDRERIRTLQGEPSGTPRRQEVRGPLVVRYVNVDTGASVVRNLTGDAILDARADGSSAITLRHGHLAVGLGATDPGGPAFLILTGRGFSVSFSAAGGRALSLGTGRVENLCRTLA